MCELSHSYAKGEPTFAQRQHLRIDRGLSNKAGIICTAIIPEFGNQWKHVFQDVVY